MERLAAPKLGWGRNPLTRERKEVGMEAGSGEEDAATLRLPHRIDGERQKAYCSITRLSTRVPRGTLLMLWKP